MEQLKGQNKHRGFASWYNEFCEKQEAQGMLWFLIPLMTLPAAVMPLSMIVMSYFPGYIFFVGISIIFFFTNITLTIAQQPTKTKITFYIITVLFHFIVPIFTFLLSA